MIRKMIPVAMLAAMVATTGCAESKVDKKDEAAKPAADAVAIVNGEAISKDAWNLWVEARTQGKSATDLTPEEKDENLNALIGMYLAAQQAKNEDLDTGANGARLELMQKSALADLVGRKYLEGKDPTPEELKAEYDKQIAAMSKNEYKARHILVDSEAKAKEIISALDKGADFGKLAEENSTDSSAKQGGDLGWFSPGRMVKPFADAVEKLKKGEYTKEPVHTEYGWHVIRLDDIRPLTPPEFDKVKQQLTQMIKRSRFQEHLDALMKEAKIERNL